MGTLPGPGGSRGWSLPSVLSMGIVYDLLIIAFCRDIIANKLVGELRKAHMVPCEVLLSASQAALKCV